MSASKKVEFTLLESFSLSHSLLNDTYLIRVVFTLLILLKSNHLTFFTLLRK